MSHLGTLYIPSLGRLTRTAKRVSSTAFTGQQCMSVDPALISRFRNRGSQGTKPSPKPKETPLDLTGLGHFVHVEKVIRKMMCQYCIILIITTSEDILSLNRPSTSHKKVTSSPWISPSIYRDGMGWRYTPKTNSSPLKNGSWETTCLWGPAYFQKKKLLVRGG